METDRAPSSSTKPLWVAVADVSPPPTHVRLACDGAIRRSAEVSRACNVDRRPQRSRRSFELVGPQADGIIAPLCTRARSRLIKRRRKHRISRRQRPGADALDLRQISGGRLPRAATRITSRAGGDDGGSSQGRTHDDQWRDCNSRGACGAREVERGGAVKDGSGSRHGEAQQEARRLPE